MHRLPGEVRAAACSNAVSSRQAGVVRYWARGPQPFSSRGGVGGADGPGDDTSANGLAFLLSERLSSGNSCAHVTISPVERLNVPAEGNEIGGVTRLRSRGFKAALSAMPNLLCRR